jgi:hypothetical protein
VLVQIAAQLWNFPDRKDTCTGGVINDYLAGSKDLNDQAVHLLFSANRHEKRSDISSLLAPASACCMHRQCTLGKRNLRLVTAAQAGAAGAALKVFVPPQHPSSVGSHSRLQGQPTLQLPTKHCPVIVSVSQFLGAQLSTLIHWIQC